MANTKQSKKRILVTERRRLRNRLHRSSARTQVKKARTSLEGSDLAAAQQAVRDAISALDRAASKGVIHKRNAARRKSRLMKRLAGFQAQVG